MKIVVTGATGFIGTELVNALMSCGYSDFFCANSKTSFEELSSEVRNADVVFHLAGNAKVNGAIEDYEQDINLARNICEASRESDLKQLLVLCSSVWASGENRFQGSSYSVVKKEIEDIFLELVNDSNEQKTVYVYRLPNVFGEYHPNKAGTAVANFCKAVASGESPKVNDPNVLLTMCYSKDVANRFVESINEWQSGVGSGYKQISPVFDITVGELAKKISAIGSLSLDDCDFDDASIEKRLLNVYRSYL